MLCDVLCDVCDVLCDVCVKCFVMCFVMCFVTRFVMCCVTCSVTCSDIASVWRVYDVTTVYTSLVSCMSLRLYDVSYAHIHKTYIVYPIHKTSRDVHDNFFTGQLPDLATLTQLVYLYV